MKNTSEMADSRLDIVEGKMSKLEGTAIETIPNITCTIKRIQILKKEHQWAMGLLQAA